MAGQKLRLLADVGELSAVDGDLLEDFEVGAGRGEPDFLAGFGAALVLASSSLYSRGYRDTLVATTEWL